MKKLSLIPLLFTASSLFASRYHTEIKPTAADLEVSEATSTAIPERLFKGRSKTQIYPYVEASPLLQAGVSIRQPARNGRDTRELDIAVGVEPIFEYFVTGRIAACYLHTLSENPSYEHLYLRYGFGAAFLGDIRMTSPVIPFSIGYEKNNLFIDGGFNTMVIFTPYPIPLPCPNIRVGLSF
ncbi:MAG: hypothetical protein JSR76_07220 [Verrucomicrobia bacterium]|nr:hypothetical protein [Verrucomicrobiota bacterium]